MKKDESADWTQYRDLPLAVEVDFHRADEPGAISYHDAMSKLEAYALAALEAAYRLGLKHVIFTHGASTSRPGRTTARSCVRALMRSPAVTPYIIRTNCIQHRTVYVAVLRENPAAPRPRTPPPCRVCGTEHTRARIEAGHFRCKDSHEFSWLDLDSEWRSTRN